MALINKHWSDGLPESALSGSPLDRHWDNGLPQGSLESGVLSISGSAGITTAEAFGSGGILTIQVAGSSGIASAEAFGSGGQVDTVILGTAGIASAENFPVGSVQYPQTVTGSAGIATAENFPVGIVAGPVTGSAGIASGEAFGEDGACGTILIGETGIETAEAFGSGGVVDTPLSIEGTTGITSAENFPVGEITQVQVFGLAGISSGEAFGADGIVAGPITGTAGIVSGETFGSGGLVKYDQTLTSSTGIASAEDFPVGFIGNLVIGVTGIESEEIFGSGGHLQLPVIGFVGIPSGERFGIGGAVLDSNVVEDVNGTYYKVFISGIDRSDQVQIGITTNRQVNFQASAQLQLFVENEEFYPDLGMPVIIYWYDFEGATGWNRIFAGSIDSSDDTKNPPVKNSGQQWYSLALIDPGKVLSRRHLSMRYTQAQFGTLSSILRHIQTYILDGEGISVEIPQDGGGNDLNPPVAIPDIEFAGVPLTEVFNRLKEITTWDWQVDFFYVLRFYDRPASVLAAPFDVTFDSANARNFQVTRTRGLYRNVQNIKANLSVTSQITTVAYEVPIDDVLPPGGNAAYARFFNGLYLYDFTYYRKVRRITEILVNGDPVPFYVNDAFAPENNTDAPDNWKFVHIAYSEIQLLWNQAQFPTGYPGPGDVVEVSFEESLEQPKPVTLRNEVEIAARSLVEGGTGIYEDTFEVSDIEDPTLLEDLAQSLLDRFGEFGFDVTFETDVFGLQPGQTILVNIPKLGASSRTLIIDSISSVETMDRLLRHQVKATNQIAQRDAMSSFERLIARLKKPTNKDREVFTFALATSQELVDGENLTNVLIVQRPVTFYQVDLNAVDPPTGQAAVFQVKLDGVSIYSPGYEIPDGDTTVKTYREFTNGPITAPKGSRLTISCTQTGSVNSGGKVTVQVIGYV